jgi:hypothetical protein
LPIPHMHMVCQNFDKLVAQLLACQCHGKIWMQIKQALNPTFLQDKNPHMLVVPSGRWRASRSHHRLHCCRQIRGWEGQKVPLRPRPGVTSEISSALGSGVTSEISSPLGPAPAPLVGTGFPGAGSSESEPVLVSIANTSDIEGLSSGACCTQRRPIWTDLHSLDSRCSSGSPTGGSRSSLISDWCHFSHTCKKRRKMLG